MLGSNYLGGAYLGQNYEGSATYYITLYDSAATSDSHSTVTNKRIVDVQGLSDNLSVTNNDIHDIVFNDGLSCVDDLNIIFRKGYEGIVTVSIGGGGGGGTRGVLNGRYRSATNIVDLEIDRILKKREDELKREDNEVLSTIKTFLKCL